MDFQHFEARAHELFDAIPEGYREGVDGLEVERGTREHPELPEVFTLGECRSEFYPSEFGGAGEVRSIVVLFYGSFLALSRVRDDWDWEDELWETITHEIRHHLESLALEDALEEVDYAEDQNFSRREGREFDPFFYRAIPQSGTGAWAVDGDIFLEHTLDAAEFGRSEWIEFEWAGSRWAAERPEELGDVHYLVLPAILPEPELFHLVLVRRRGLGEWVRGLLGRRRLEVLQSEGSARELHRTRRAE